MLEVGRLPIAAIRKVIEAVEDEGLGTHAMLGAAHYAIGAPVEPEAGDEERRTARETVDRLIADLGWTVGPLAPTRDELAQTLVTLERLGMPAGRADLIPYATTAMRLAREHEMDKIPFDGPR